MVESEKVVTHVALQAGRCRLFVCLYQLMVARAIGIGHEVHVETSAEHDLGLKLQLSASRVGLKSNSSLNSGSTSAVLVQGPLWDKC